MSDEFKKIESLFEKLRDYVNTRLAQSKLSLAEKISTVAALMIALLMSALVFFLFLVLACTAAAIALGQYLGNLWLGFLIIAGVVFLLAVLIWSLRDKIIKKPIINQLIKAMFKKDDEEE